MKKVISMVTLFVFALVLNSAAQIAANPGGGTTATYELKNVIVSSVKINEGANTVPVFKQWRHRKIYKAWRCN